MLSEQAYTEDCVYLAQNIDGGGMTYSTVMPQPAAPVTLKDGAMVCKLAPHGEPMFAVSKSGMPAKMTGTFTSGAISKKML